ncbi:hypothetical protein BP6252_12868 [Coleophoma cylindrospora]|uniref:Uncharacterized protein n=1 Tax=Coleophoma cylindrospora TaxID=1849047 RepID=A0A3D8QDJ2_9HELO|nr:hypothetical protein BP6252_12868 [Coleophoma cylindrospora]
MELQKFAKGYDLESQMPRPRQRNFMPQGSILNDQLHDGTSETSTRSSSIYTPKFPNILWPQGRAATNTSASTTLADFCLTPGQEEFVNFVVGVSVQWQSQPIMKMCGDWYIRYLDSKVRSSWKVLYLPILEGVANEHSTDDVSSSDVSVAFRLLAAVLEELRKDKVGLVQIVDELYNKYLLHHDKEDVDGERLKAIQLVFTAIGWISSLYTPNNPADTPTNCLQLQPVVQDSPNVQSSRLSQNRMSKVFRSICENIEDAGDVKFYSLMKKFSPEIIPKYGITSQLGHGSPLGSPRMILQPLKDAIEQRLVCFATLKSLGNIAIKWVDNTRQHLEFDARRKVLYLFENPSICLIHAVKDTSVLAKIFENSAGNNFMFRDPDEHDDAKLFYREILLSYRLLFGQNYKSYNRFTMPKETEMQDPLLKVLCSQSYDDDEPSEVYYLIDANHPARTYCARNDFPFLGERLLKIQSHVRDLQPHSIREIWNDTRNLPYWWGFWTAIAFGALSILLQALQ